MNLSLSATVHMDMEVREVLRCIEQCGGTQGDEMKAEDRARITSFMDKTARMTPESCVLRQHAHEGGVLSATLDALERMGVGVPSASDEAMQRSSSKTTTVEEAGCAVAQNETTFDLLIEVVTLAAAFSASKTDVIRWLRCASRAQSGIGCGESTGDERRRCSSGSGGNCIGESGKGMRASFRVRMIHALARAIELSSRLPKELFVFGESPTRAGGLVCGSGDGKGGWWPFGDGFCVAMWCCLDDAGLTHTTISGNAQVQRHPTLFSFLTSDGLGLEAFFHGNFLVIDERLETKNSTKAGGCRAHFGFTFEPARWYFLVIEYNPSSSIRKQRSGLSSGNVAVAGGSSDTATSSSSTKTEATTTTMSAATSMIRLRVDGDAFVESLPFELMKIKSPLAFCCIATSPPGGRTAAGSGGDKRDMNRCALIGLTSVVYIFNSVLSDNDVATLRQLGPDFVPSISADEGDASQQAFRGGDLTSKLWRCHHPSTVRANRCRSIASANHEGDSRKDCVLIEGTAVITRHLLADSLWCAAECGVVGLVIPLLIPSAVLHPLFDLAPGNRGGADGIHTVSSFSDDAMSMASGILRIFSATIRCHRMSREALRSCETTFGCSFSEMFAHILRVCVHGGSADMPSDLADAVHTAGVTTVEDDFVIQLFELIDAALNSNASWIARAVMNDILIPPEFHWALGAPAVMRALLRGLIATSGSDSEKIFRNVGGVVRLTDVGARLIHMPSNVYAQQQLEDIARIIEVSLSSETDVSVIESNLEALVSCVARMWPSRAERLTRDKTETRRLMTCSYAFLSLISRLVQNPSRERKAMLVTSLVGTGFLGVISNVLDAVFETAADDEETREEEGAIDGEDDLQKEREDLCACTSCILRDVSESESYEASFSDAEKDLITSLRRMVRIIAPQLISSAADETIGADMDADMDGAQKTRAADEDTATETYETSEEALTSPSSSAEFGTRHPEYFSHLETVLETQHARCDAAVQESLVARLRTSEGLAELLKRQFESGVLLAEVHRSGGVADDDGWELDAMETSTRQRLRLRRNYNAVRHRNARDKCEPDTGAVADPSGDSDRRRLSSTSVTPEVAATAAVDQFKPRLQEDDTAAHHPDEEDGVDMNDSASLSRTSTPVLKSSKKMAADMEGDLGLGLDSPTLNGLANATDASLRDGSSADLRVIVEEKCERVTLSSTSEGSFQVTAKYILFVESLVSALEGESEHRNQQIRHVWRIDKIGQIHSRRYLLRPSALEIFMLDRSSVFFDFGSAKARLRIFRAIRSLSPPNLLSAYAVTTSLRPDRILAASGLTAQWVSREISNFDYLMHLNTIAGRTYNDVTQWPIFPWVVSDYESETLDLENARSFRDLSKPIGALSPERHEKFLERYRDLEQAADMTGLPPFHYGSHYSTSGSVIFYMIRVEPFTSLAVDLQGGQFDHADRLFSNIPATWRSCQSDMSDVKELTPEFYYQPAIFENTCNLDLGTTQSGEKLGDVVLPPWAKTPHEFVSKLRAALESEIVSAMLHEWIDLIFGYKQRGKEAVLATNVFYYTTYEGAVELDDIDDADMRRAARDQIAFFGQTPSQLLKSPHPARRPIDQAIATLPSATPGTFRKYDLLSNPSSSTPTYRREGAYDESWEYMQTQLRLCADKHTLLVVKQGLSDQQPDVLARHTLHPNTPDDDGKPFLFRRDPSHYTRGFAGGILGSLKKAFSFGGMVTAAKDGGSNSSGAGRLSRRSSLMQALLKEARIPSKPAVPPFLVMDDCKHILRGVPGRGSLQLLSVGGSGNQFKVVESVEPHSLPVSALAISRDGGAVLAASCDGTLSVWYVNGLKSGQSKSTASDGTRSSTTPSHHQAGESALQAETSQSRFMMALMQDWSESMLQQEMIDSALQDVRSHGIRGTNAAARDGVGTAGLGKLAATTEKKSALSEKSLKKKQMQRKLIGPLALVRAHQGPVMACAIDVDMDLAVSCSAETGTVLSSIKEGRVLRVLHEVTGERVAIMRSGYVVIWSARARQLCSCSINGDEIVRRDIDERFGDIVDMQTTVDGLYVIVGSKVAVHIFFGCELRPTHEIVIADDSSGDDGLAAFLLDALETTLIIFTRNRALRVYNDPVVSAKIITRGLEAGWGGLAL